jgi:hypothetical protein
MGVCGRTPLLITLWQARSAQAETADRPAPVLLGAGRPVLPVAGEDVGPGGVDDRVAEVLLQVGGDAVLGFGPVAVPDAAQPFGGPSGGGRRVGDQVTTRHSGVNGTVDARTDVAPQ